jgi:hypothetical protein
VSRIRQVTDSVSGDPLINLLAVGDLNDDGHLDLIAKRYNNLKGIDEHSQMVELLGRGDGTFGGPRKLAIDWSGNLELLDWNGDGALGMFCTPAPQAPP